MAEKDWIYRENPHIATTLPPTAGSGGMPNLRQLYQDTIAYAGCMRSHGDPTFPTPTTVDNASEQVVGWAQPGDLKGPTEPVCTPGLRCR